MALKDLLDAEIKKTLSSEEQDFYALDALIEEEKKKSQSDFGRKAFKIIEVTIEKIDKASIDELQLRLTRLNNLKKYTKEAEVGDIEEQLVLSAIAEAEKALTKQLKNRKAFFTKTKKLISQNTIDVGALLIGITAGDPLVALGVKLVGDMMRARKERKLEAEQDEKDTIREDAESLKPKLKSGLGGKGGNYDDDDWGSLYGGGYSGGVGPLTRAPMNYESYSPESFGLGGGNAGGDSGAKNHGAVMNILQDIFLFTEEISDDVKQLVTVAREKNRFDDLEASRESGGVGGGLVRSKDVGAKGQKSGALSKIIDTIGVRGGVGLGKMVGKYGAVLGLTAFLLYGAYDTISSYIKTGKAGNSDWEKMMGQFDIPLIRMFTGRYARSGAIYGSIFFPLIGPIIGGLLGVGLDLLSAAVEAITPSKNPFEGSLDAIWNFLTSTFDSLIKNLFAMAERAVSFLPETAGVRAAAAKKIQESKASVLGAPSKLEELDTERRTGTGRFATDAKGGVKLTVGESYDGDDDPAEQLLGLFGFEDRTRTDAEIYQSEKELIVADEKKLAAAKRKATNKKRASAKARLEARQQLRRNKDAEPKGRLSEEALVRVNEIAANLKIKPEWLISVMAFETGGTFDPAERTKAKDKNGNRGSATGLIQFTEATAKGMKTSTAALAQMSQVEQLDYVESYLIGRGATGAKSAEDLYQYVLRGSLSGGPEDSDIFDGSQKKYDMNIGLDQDGDGKITKSEAYNVGPAKYAAASSKMVAMAAPSQSIKEVDSAGAAAGKAIQTAQAGQVVIDNSVKTVNHGGGRGAAPTGGPIGTTSAGGSATAIFGNS